MFGLTRREQRWAAEQKAAETLVPLAIAAIEARTAMDTNARIAELEAALATAQTKVQMLQADAGRLNELQHRYIGADFMYGDDKRTVLLFDWSGRAITKDLRVTIDAAAPPTSDPPE